MSMVTRVASSDTGLAAKHGPVAEHPPEAAGNGLNVLEGDIRGLAGRSKYLPIEQLVRGEPPVARKATRWHIRAGHEKFPHVKWLGSYIQVIELGMVDFQGQIGEGVLRFGPAQDAPCSKGRSRAV